MDVTNALVLVAVIVAATEFAKRIAGQFGIETDGWQTQAVSLGVAVGAVFLVGETVWAGEQVIGAHGLDTLGVADKVLAGLMLGFGANFADRGVRSIAHIGSASDEVDLPR